MRPVTTSEEVISHLREMIHRGELRPGDRLPPERDLARILGISRPTLRAGIRTLAAVGVLPVAARRVDVVGDVGPSPESQPARAAAPSASETASATRAGR